MERHFVEQSTQWKLMAGDLAVRVISPAEVELDGAVVTFTALLPDFGREAGMIVDPDWHVIKPHADALLRQGYGYSCMSVSGDLSSLKEVLADWGWIGSIERKPDWLGPLRVDCVEKLGFQR